MMVHEMKQNARQCIRLAKQCVSVENAAAFYATADYWIRMAAALEKEDKRTARYLSALSRL